MVNKFNSADLFPSAPIPIIDIFAGPGGLGEGFSALLNKNEESVFEIVLSIEKEVNAHETLTLRSFFRQFKPLKAPNDYYEFLRGNISIDELYKRYPVEAKCAKEEAWLAELGEGENAVAAQEVDKKIKKALNKQTNWLLIGGPPCQSYSVVGRSRRQEKILNEKKDKRVGLYKQYLRILAVHNPAVFVMENVKGLLSARTKESPVFSKILNDLSNPSKACLSDYSEDGIQLSCPGYKIYSCVVAPKRSSKNGFMTIKHKDYVIKTEKYGIPQTRHRVILLGIRNDIDYIPEILSPQKAISISKVLADLPRLRSRLSKIRDNKENWEKTLKDILLRKRIMKLPDRKVLRKMKECLKKISVPNEGAGKEYITLNNLSIGYNQNWFLDSSLDGLCNHVSRGHMRKDIHRYLFVSCFGKVHKRSPKLEDFPNSLLPKHKNVDEGIEKKKFADRFRVQLWNKPSKTITSHISKDGHYYIHPDPTQCRSLTVREAARIQTFPDNYFFSGPRTSQFVQVGNAVPPLLAYQIASIVQNIFININTLRKFTEMLSKEQSYVY